jgi:DNA polymerase-1
MLRVWNRLRQEQPEAKLVLQIHDELIVECPENQAEAVKALVTEEMQKAATLAVPLLADAHSGKSWYEAK